MGNMLYLLWFFAIQATTTTVSVYPTFSLQTFTSSTQFSSSSFNTLGLTSGNGMTVMFFIKFTTLASSSKSVATLDFFDITVSSSSITATNGSRTATVNWSSMSNKWIFMYASCGSKMYICYVTEGSSSSSFAQSTNTNCNSISNSAKIIIGAGGTNAGGLHSLTVFDSYLNSDPIQYTLTKNLYGLDAISSSTYSLKVILIQLNLFSPYTSLSSSTNTLYTDLSNNYVYDTFTSSFTFTLTGTLSGTSYTTSTSISIFSQTTTSIASTSNASPFDPTATSLSITLPITTSTEFSSVCNPTGSSYSSMVQTISASTFNTRQYFLYSVYTAGSLYPTSIYTMVFLPYGVNSVQSKAITGQNFAITLPFAQTDLAYLLGYTITVSTCPTTCTITGTQLSVTSPTDASVLVFKITSGTDYHYSKLLFSVNTGAAPVVSSLSAVTLTSSGLVTSTLPFTDAYYGNTDLYTHGFAYSTTSTDTIIIDSSVRPAVYYWTATASASVTFTVTSIGGSSGSATLTAVINNPPILSTIPTLYGWSGCIVTYTPVTYDADSNTLTLSADIAVLSGSQINWSDSLNSTAEISLTDGTNTVTQTVTRTLVASPSFLISTLTCVVYSICISTYANTYSLDTDIASITSSVSSVSFGTYIYLVPNIAGVISPVITVTSTYGCVFSETLVITSYAELSVPLTSVFCESSGTFSVTSSTSLTGVSVSDSSLTISGNLITGACTSKNYFCIFTSSTSVGYQAFAVTSFDVPVFLSSLPTTPIEGVSWTGTLAASNCPIGTCIYGISGDSGLTIQEVTGYTQWTSPSDLNLTLTITRKNIIYSNIYSVITAKTITLDTVDQSFLQTYFGVACSLNISSTYAGVLTLTTVPALTITDMLISFENPSVSETYLLTASDSGTRTTLNLRLYVLDKPSPYLPSEFDSSDLFCEVGTNFTLDITKCK